MERTLGERTITASHLPLPSAEEVRAIVRELVEDGYWRWTDPNRTLEDYPNDEPLPVEPTGKLFPIEVSEEEGSALLEFFGVGGPTEGQRTVEISSRSTVVCPAHGTTLVPDVCRSCAFLAGEAG